MKIEDIDDRNLEKVLKTTDLEHFFDVYLDKYGNYSYNLNKGLYFKFDSERLPKYECKHQMFWPLISYKIYGTTRLAWLLMKINDVQDDELFLPKQPGDTVRYISQEQIQYVVEEINNRSS